MQHVYFIIYNIVLPLRCELRYDLIVLKVPLNRNQLLKWRCSNGVVSSAPKWPLKQSSACVMWCLVVANSLRQYGTTSAVLTDPSRLSQEAVQAASQRLSTRRWQPAQRPSLGGRNNRWRWLRLLKRQRLLVMLRDSLPVSESMLTAQCQSDELWPALWHTDGTVPLCKLSGWLSVSYYQWHCTFVQATATQWQGKCSLASRLSAIEMNSRCIGREVVELWKR